MSVSESEKECPLCMEALDWDDLGFYPCSCGYQICRFCWHRLRTDENGLCPACRQAFPDIPVSFNPEISAEELKKQKRRNKERKSNKDPVFKPQDLATLRVVQKNLVFVIGLSSRLTQEDLKKEFAHFGKIIKFVHNKSTAYITYSKPEEAIRAIRTLNASAAQESAAQQLQLITNVTSSTTTTPTTTTTTTTTSSAVAATATNLAAVQTNNNIINLNGTNSFTNPVSVPTPTNRLKASLGTTKYCNHFLRSQQCPKVGECMYLHEIAEAEASFTKEQMQAGKHVEYEKKLMDSYVASLSQPPSLQMIQQQQQQQQQQLQLQQQQQQQLQQQQLLSQPQPPQPPQPQQSQQQQPPPQPTQPQSQPSQAPTLAPTQVATQVSQIQPLQQQPSQITQHEALLRHQIAQFQTTQNQQSHQLQLLQQQQQQQQHQQQQQQQQQQQHQSALQALLQNHNQSQPSPPPPIPQQSPSPTTQQQRQIQQQKEQQQLLQQHQQQLQQQLQQQQQHQHQHQHQQQQQHQHQQQQQQQQQLSSETDSEDDGLDFDPISVSTDGLRDLLDQQLQMQNYLQQMSANQSLASVLFQQNGRLNHQVAPTTNRLLVDAAFNGHSVPTLASLAGLTTNNSPPSQQEQVAWPNLSTWTNFLQRSGYGFENGS